MATNLFPDIMMKPVQITLKWTGGPDVKSVGVAGDFNGWEVVILEKAEEGWWQVALQVTGLA